MVAHCLIYPTFHIVLSHTHTLYIYIYIYIYIIIFQPPVYNVGLNALTKKKGKNTNCSQNEKL